MEKLIFVYNANSGILNNWMDIAHKVVSPATYECDLCALTHGSFREKRIWKKFRDASTIPMEFYHKDEFQRKYRSKWLPTYDFPVILYAGNEHIEPFITATCFNEIKTVEGLIRRIETSLAQDYH